MQKWQRLDRQTVAKNAAVLAMANIRFSGAKFTLSCRLSAPEIFRDAGNHSPRGEPPQTPKGISRKKKKKC
jgi:hypothetical protein